MRWVFLMPMLCALALIVGCSRSGSTGGAASKAGSHAKDQATEVEHRFAVFSPAIGVMLRDLGFEDSVVGRHSFDSALSKSIPVVGSHIDVDYEMLLSVEPTDVFFEINESEIPPKVISLAKEHDWQIWSYKLETLDDIANTVDDLYFKLVGFSQPAPSADPFNIVVDPSAKFQIDLPSARLASAWSPMGRPASDAGRVLLLASLDPPGAMGPGSFHAQLIDRLGLSPAIESGGMWQELDYEDIVHLNPDSIIVLKPREPDPVDLIGEPQAMSWDEIRQRVGGIADLPISAVHTRRIAIIEDPLGLLPSTSLARVADEIREAVMGWAKDGP